VVPLTTARVALLLLVGIENVTSCPLTGAPELLVMVAVMVEVSPAFRVIDSAVKVRLYVVALDVVSLPLVPPLPQAVIQQHRAKQINKFNKNKILLFVDFAILLSFIF
jgi:hypothetical protein